MNRRLLWGAVFGGVWAYCATQPARVRVTAVQDVEPEPLLDLVSQVEREPEFIPTVQDVQVEDRLGETVRYRVEVQALGIPAWARFQKRIRPDEGWAVWFTLEGMLGMEQRGRFYSIREGGHTLTTIDTETRFNLPLLGPLLAHGSRPFLSFAFAAWLRNLEAHLTEGRSAGATLYEEPPSHQREGTSPAYP